MIVCMIRFKWEGGGWSRWYSGEEDFSFLNRKDIMAVEIHEMMSREDAITYLAKLRERACDV